MAVHLRRRRADRLGQAGEQSADKALEAALEVRIGGELPVVADFVANAAEQFANRDLQAFAHAPAGVARYLQDRDALAVGIAPGGRELVVRMAATGGAAAAPARGG